MAIILPFPDEPDGAYAESITSQIVPLFEAARDEAYLTRLKGRDDSPMTGQHLKYQRIPKTYSFRDDTREAIMQLGIAFYAIHGSKGWSCDAESKRRNPVRFGCEKVLAESGFTMWMLHEVNNRKTGLDPVPLSRDQERINALVQALRGIEGVGLVQGSLPFAQPAVSPTEKVLADAVDYYNWVVRSLYNL